MTTQLPPGVAPLALAHPDGLPERRPLDKYRTPSWVTAALIESYPELRGELLIDPCAGDCRMSTALRAAGRFAFAVTNDIDESEPTDFHVDCCDPKLWGVLELPHASAWAVTNPAFIDDIPTRLAWHAINSIKRGGVALLLRSTWLEPWEDRQWLGRFPPRSELVLPRFSFTGKGSDTSGCRWLLWGDVEPGIKVYTKKPGQMDLING